MEVPERRIQYLLEWQWSNLIGCYWPLHLDMYYTWVLGTGRLNYGRYSWLDCYHIKEACTVAYTSRHINTTWLIGQSRTG